MIDGLADCVQRCGVLHMHTRYSDGGVSVADMSSTAAALGLDFVAITDHMTLAGQADVTAAERAGAPVIVGYEHNDTHVKHHYLVFETGRVVDEQVAPQGYVNQVRALGGIGFIAHPFEKRHYFQKLPPYPWLDWGVDGYDGIEIWNQMSDWTEGLRSWRSFVRLMYPRRLLAGPPRELLAKWDELNQKRFVSGVGGVDAHTRVVRAGPFRYTVFPLKVEMKGIRTHVYLDGQSGEISKKRILHALRDGCGYVSNFRQGDARGALFGYRTHEGVVIPPGRAGDAAAPGGVLAVSLPHVASIRFIRNGRVVGRFLHTRVASMEVSSPGVYRIEVARGLRPWIYTNPLRIGLG